MVITEDVLWKMISGLFAMLLAIAIWWRKKVDTTDETMAKDIKKLEQEIMSKLSLVLANQHSTDLKIEKSFILIDQHTHDLRKLLEKTGEHEKLLAELDKGQAVNEEWKKKMEERLPART